MRKSKKMQQAHSLLAGLLALVMVMVPVLSSLSALEANAAEQQWYHVQAGSGNGNGHAYSNASSQPAAVLLNESPMPAAGGELSLSYQKMGTLSHARFGVFYCYLDDNNWLYVGCNPGGTWYYEYKSEGQGDYPPLESLQNQTDDSIVQFSMSVEGSTLTVKVNDTTATIENAALQALMEKANGTGKYGFRAGNFKGEITEFRFADMKLGDTPVSNDWGFLADCAGQLFEAEKIIQNYQVTGKVVDKDGTALSGASAQIGDTTVTSDSNGVFLFPSIAEGTHQIAVSLKGYKAVRQGITVEGDTNLGNITLEARSDVTYDTYIESEEIKAAVSKTFPQVMQYEMKTGSQKGTKFYGQDEELSIIKINGTDIAAQLVGEAKLEADKITYVMNLKNAGNNIDMQMTVEISVKENDLTWKVTDITKKDGCAKIGSIEVPNLNLITVRDDQADTQFMGTNNSGNVAKSLDEELHFGSGFKANDSKAYSYGFLSADGLSAGVFSNSEATVSYHVVPGDSETDGDSRLLRINGEDSMSITSNVWYYEYGNLREAVNYDNIPVSELPVAKVCVTADLNEDGKADWQDGAIAYRDIMQTPQGAEDVPELVNYRIAMNFASQGAQPFLRTADNIMKTYLATDGLEQAVMLKGYGNEGHDSANTEYGDIGERIGGAEDMKKLIELAHKYNTEIGVHVNAQEMYPEAKSFSDLMTSPGFGWGWLDQSYAINRVYDLGTGLRYKRFLQLYDQLNDTNLYGTKWPQLTGTGTNEQETIADAETIKRTVEQSVKDGTNMDFIYLDVWYGQPWETRKIAQQINSLGWRFTTEFGVQGEYNSTWQHWATDKKYGGSDGKGHNSDVRRFIKNHQTDSFVLNDPSIRGAADNPLLGGMDIFGFEGWQNNNNFDTYIDHTFGINLPAKFLQHYEVVKWENYPEVNGVSASPVGNHEKEITLKNKTGDTVVVTRNETQRADDFVERTITLNGKEVLNDVRYLIPWTDRNTGEEKLYHWNYDGGESTWKLQDDWAGLANVKVYALSDQGRGQEQVVKVENGSVTLTAEPHVAYVILKGTAANVQKTVTYGEKNYVQDPGFNAYAGLGEGTPLNSGIWNGDIKENSVKVVRRTSGDQNLAIDSPSQDIKVSTEISGLTAGKDYVAEVYVDNQSDKNAYIEVTGAEETVSNYTGKSLAGNYIRCDSHNQTAVSGSRMQIMQVSFKAASDKATINLKREAGDGITYFDDIRIVQKTLNNYREDGSFVQDFETVVQGFYPFVLGPAQGVDDPSTHLSQMHAPYTQCGYRQKLMDDVIDGEWSLKHHNHNQGIIYRTIPQNFRFEANTTYEVSFDYQAGLLTSYGVVLGAGENAMRWMDYLEKTAAKKAGEECTTKTASFLITGQEDGQSWFGIYSDGKAIYNDKGQDISNKLGDFDFILDNLVIKEAPVSLSKANLRITDAGKAQKLSLRYQSGVNAESVTWTSSDEDVVAVDQDGNLSCYGYGSATITADVVINGKTYELSCDVSVPKGEKIEQDQNVEAVYANTEQTSGEPAPSGFASAILDGNASTYWHSQWSPNKFVVSDSNPAILTFKLKDGADAIGGFEFLQRSGSENGIISKFEYIVGNEFNESSNVLEGTTYGPVTVENPSGGAWVDVELPEVMDGQYVQIRILSGSNDFACMSGFKTYGMIVYEGNKLAAQKKELRDSVAKAKAVENDNYTADSWNAFQNALKEAEKLLIADSSEEAIRAAMDKLQKAKAALTANPSVDEELVSLQAQLKTKVNEAKAVKNDNYTDVTWNAFQNALKAAENVMNGSDKTAITNAIQALQKAKDGLVKKPDVPKVKLATPKVSKAASGVKGVTVKWKAVPGAASYVVKRNGKTIGTVKKTSYVDQTPKGNAVNKYTVIAKGDPSRYIDSAAGTKATKKLPARAALKSAKKGRKGQASLKWKSVKGASSYTILRSAKLNGTYKKVKTLKKGTTFTDKRAKGKVLYYKVVVKKGKLYGPASKPRKVKM